MEVFLFLFKLTPVILTHVVWGRVPSRTALACASVHRVAQEQTASSVSRLRVKFVPQVSEH